jgi:hypothetical protein
MIQNMLTSFNKSAERKALLQETKLIINLRNVATDLTTLYREIVTSLWRHVRT